MSSASLGRHARPYGTLGAAVGVLAVALVASAAASGQEQSPIKGEAALKHPAVHLALKAAELIKGGKVDEAFALGTKQSQSAEKLIPAAERRDFMTSITAKTPDPKALADAIRKGGELNILGGDMAILNVPVANGRIMAYFEREGGAWRLTNGPMVMVAEPDSVNETRVENAEILTHPIGILALQYFDLVHAGKMDDARKLATSAVQAKWRTNRQRSGQRASRFSGRICPLGRR